MIIWFTLMTSMSLIQRWWSKEINHAHNPQFLQSLWRRAKRQLLKSLWWPIYVINSVDNNKLPCEELTDERMSFPVWKSSCFFFFFQYFTANRDRISIVENVLSPPIQTRYLRLHPWGWHGYISMRAEFYGCRSGNELKWYDCSKVEKFI